MKRPGRSARTVALVEILVLGEKDIDDAISLAESVAAVEESFVDYSSGVAMMPHKLHLEIPGTKGFMRVMPSALPRLGYAGVKMYLDPSYGSVNSPAVFVLFDVNSGIPVAILGANRLSQLRTGAASAVATKYLARKDASVAGIIGSGKHAKTQLEGTVAVRSIKSARVYSPNVGHMKAFAREMNSRLGIEVKASLNPHMCAHGSDVICAATTSKTPVLANEDVLDGAHLNTIGSSFPGRSELDPALFKRSKIVVDCLSQALSGVEGSDISGMIAEGMMKESDIYAELGEVIVGSKPGREKDAEVTLFKNTGMAIWDVACAARAYDRAKRESMGTWIVV